MVLTDEAAVAERASVLERWCCSETNSGVIVMLRPLPPVLAWKFQGQQFLEVVVEMTTPCQTVQHAGEIRLGVEAIQLCGLDDRIEDCRAVTAAVGTEEQKILARDSDASQQSLRQIVVDAEPAVVDIAAVKGIQRLSPVCNAFAFNGVLPDSRRR